MKRMFAGLLSLFLLGSPVHAEQMMMVRVGQSFPETMMKLQEVINARGYQLSRVQRVDIGLTTFGYVTDKYRIVFFGKQAQNRWLIDKHPELIAYLPLKIAVYAEDQDTLLVAYNPEDLLQPGTPELKKLVHEWQVDIQKILSEMHDFGNS